MQGTVAIQMSDKIEFKSKFITRNKEQHIDQSYKNYKNI